MMPTAIPEQGFGAPWHLWQWPGHPPDPSTLSRGDSTSLVHLPFLCLTSSSSNSPQKAREAPNAAGLSSAGKAGSSPEPVQYSQVSPELQKLVQWSG